jgi:hypothetical protein
MLVQPEMEKGRGAHTVRFVFSLRGVRLSSLPPGFGPAPGCADWKVADSQKWPPHVPQSEQYCD